MNLFIHNWLVRLFSLIAVLITLYLVIWLEKNREDENSRHANSMTQMEVFDHNVA